MQLTLPHKVHKKLTIPLTLKSRVDQQREELLKKESQRIVNQLEDSFKRNRLITAGNTRQHTIVSDEQTASVHKNTNFDILNTFNICSLDLVNSSVLGGKGAEQQVHQLQLEGVRTLEKWDSHVRQSKPE